MVIAIAAIASLKSPILYARYLFTITGLLMFSICYFISKENNNIKITDSNYELLRELLNYASSMSIKMEEQKISSLLLNVENKLKEDSDPFNNLPF